MANEPARSEAQAETRKAPIPDDEWTTVSEEIPQETKMEFYYPGDNFIGEYLGSRQLNGENRTYNQYRFRGDDREIYFVAGASLDNSMRRVRIGNRVRITYIDDQDTGQRTPMKLFKVDVAKRR